MTTDQKHTPIADDFALQLSEFNAWRKTQNDGYTALNVWMEATNRKTFEIDHLAAKVKELEAGISDLGVITREKENQLIAANLTVADYNELLNKAVASLKDIESWVDRWCAPDHPVSVIAKRVIAKIEAGKV